MYKAGVGQRKPVRNGKDPEVTAVRKDKDAGYRAASTTPSWGLLLGCRKGKLEAKGTHWCRKGQAPPLDTQVEMGRRGHREDPGPRAPFS